MRLIHLLAAVVVLSAVPVIAQKPESGATASKKGDVVTIRGCLAWPTLVQEGVRKIETTANAATAYTYRLSGDKNLVKPLQKEHSHTIVEVTGVLTSTGAPPPATRGKDFPGGRVEVGGIGQTAPPPTEIEPPLLLRVTSFEATHTRCNPAP